MRCTSNMRPPDAQGGDAAGAANGRAADLGQFDAVNELAIGLIRGARELDERHDSAKLRDAASRACQRLLESKDRDDVWRGLRFFLALQRQQVQIFHLEVELAKSGIDHVTRTTVARIKSEFTR